ncbi:MAG: ROK family protein, partial [Clostridia bacterium]|nr:ROK family protein [Clostridia bacterium]
MKIIEKLNPPCKDYIWGGNKLKGYGKISDGDRIAETWEISYHKDGKCLTADGRDIVEAFGKEGLGKNCDGFEFFPTLVKLIDAADNLSVQVHPSDDYALKNEGQFGKTEMWYIVDAEDGAGIYLGLKKEVSKEEFLKATENGTVLELLNFYPVKRGESYFIKSGTLHAIGKGVLICEIQQNSNLTYRVYDYKRKGADGKERPLHLDKALKVIDFSAFNREEKSFASRNGKIIGINKYFTATKSEISGEGKIRISDNSFCGLTVVDGEGKIENISVKKGDTVMISAGYGECEIKGEIEFIMTEVKKYYVGIDIGGTFIKGGIVNDDGEIIVYNKVPTEVGKGERQVLSNIVGLITTLLKSAGMQTRDIEGVGMGVPGMIDSKSGVVVFSNNLKWKNFHIADVIEKEVGVKVKIANDANVAALGEAKFGAGKEFEDNIMLTLGTGVGGGIVIGNKLLEGNKSAGAELGHMVIEEGGELCSCGRKGCLEAYASATALIRET